MNEPADTVTAVRAFVDASETFIEIARRLRALPDVVSVAHPCTMRREIPLGDGRIAVGDGLGFRVEWYADAEFADGRALSFCEELSWHDGEWTVAAAITTVTGNDQEQLLELPESYATQTDDLARQLGVQARLLLDSVDAAVRKFGGG
jgi:hypothetical protein